MQSCLSLLLAGGSLLTGYLPAPHIPRTVEPNLLGTWTLMHVVYMGQKTDQVWSSGGPRAPEEIEAKPVVHWRTQITFDKEKFIVHGEQEWPYEVPYQVEWNRNPAVLKSNKCLSTVRVDHDVLLWCYRAGGNRRELPKGFAPNSKVKNQYLLVFRRGKW